MGDEVLDPVWRLVAPEGLLWHHWEHDSTLFNRLTGETHLLGPLPVELLVMLQDGPRRLSELARLLGALCDHPVDEGWMRRVEGMLEELESLELVERQYE